MQQLEIIKPSAAPKVGPMRTMLHLIRPWFNGRRGLVVAGVAVVVAGLALGWNWLAAVGVAPLILSLAPCAVMCAFGMCMMMKGNSSVSKPDSLDQAKPPESTSPPSQSGG